MDQKDQLDTQLPAALRHYARSLGSIDGLPATVSHAADLIESLQAQSHQLEMAAQHWKANHDNVVAKLKVVTEREDLPVDRTAAYNHVLELEKAVAQMGNLVEVGNIIGMSTAQDSPFVCLQPAWRGGQTPPSGTRLFAMRTPVEDFEKAAAESVKQGLATAAEPETEGGAAD